ncbi:MAG: hypothetical protein ACYC5A_08885 [Thermoleophilia bacterium]
MVVVPTLLPIVLDSRVKIAHETTAGDAASATARLPARPGEIGFFLAEII